MKYYLILLLSVMAYGSAAQKALPYKVYDFSDVDVRSVNPESIGRQLDSIYRTSGYDSLSQLYAYSKSVIHTQKYVAFTIGYQISLASLSGLNSDLESIGFNELPETFDGIPWGVDVRGKRLLFSYLLVPGIKNKASNNDHTIALRTIGMELAIGYDILNFKRLQFYPQVALGLQDLDVEFSRKSATADVITVNDMVLQPAGTQLERRSIVLSYGAEMDYHVRYTPGRHGIILGIRYGVTSTLVNGKFKIDGQSSSFSFSDEICRSFFSAVLKFYMRR